MGPRRAGQTNPVEPGNHRPGVAGEHHGVNNNSNTDVSLSSADLFLYLAAKR